MNPASDAPEFDADDRPWRPAGAGASFVYVIPCAHEDILKLGMSRDPLGRFQTLHPRYFDFFDFDQALLVQTDSVREARAIELRLGRSLALHRAPAPLGVAATAGGHTEWYRGALAELQREAAALREAGHRVQQPLREWMAEALRERGRLLFHWSQQMLEAIEVEKGPGAPPARPGPLEWTLRNALDAYAAFGLDFGGQVPERVARWHAENAPRFLR
jgi:hypothetical protein